MEYNLPKGYLSASSMATYLRCGYQYKFRYIDGIVVPPNAAMTKGKVVHNVFEKYYGTILEGGNRMPPSEVKDMSVDFLEKEYEKCELGNPDDDTRRELEIISETYTDNVGREIQPVAVEEEVRYQTSGGVELLAYIDLVHEKDDYSIADYKITGKKWNLTNLKNNLQFMVYALTTGLSDIEVHNIVRSTKTPKVFNKQAEEGVLDVSSNIRVLSHQFDQATQVSFLEEQIEQIAKAITVGIFVPADPSSWCCNPTWCGYWEYCRGRQN